MMRLVDRKFAPSAWRAAAGIITSRTLASSRRWNMPRPYLRVLIVWVVTLAALYIVQRYFAG